MNEAQAGVVTRAGDAQREWFAIDEYFRPWIGLVESGDHLDHRRLAAAVLADQRPDLARLQFHVDVDQRTLTSEGLGKPWICKAGVSGIRLLQSSRVPVTVLRTQ